jgi:hypothetical protein
MVAFSKHSRRDFLRVGGIAASAIASAFAIDGHTNHHSQKASPPFTLPPITKVNYLRRKEALADLDIIPTDPHNIFINETIRLRLESSLYLAILARPERKEMLKYLRFAVASSLPDINKKISLELSCGFIPETIFLPERDRVVFTDYELFGGKQADKIAAVRKAAYKFQALDPTKNSRPLAVLLPIEGQMQVNELSPDYNFEALCRLSSVSWALDAMLSVIARGTTTEEFTAKVLMPYSPTIEEVLLWCSSFNGVYPVQGEPATMYDISGTTRQNCQNFIRPLSAGLNESQLITELKGHLPPKSRRGQIARRIKQIFE